MSRLSTWIESLTLVKNLKITIIINDKSGHVSMLYIKHTRGNLQLKLFRTDLSPVYLKQNIQLPLQQKYEVVKFF